MNKRGAFLGFLGRKYNNPYYELIKLKVSDVMTRDVITAHRSDSLIDGAHTMIASKVSCLVVIDNKVPIGILTERDFIKKLEMNHDTKTEKMIVSDVMRKQPHTISEDLNLFQAQQEMYDYKARKLVVVDKNGLLSGIITQTDLCRVVDGLKTPFVNPPLVSDFMTRKVLTASVQDKFTKVKNLLSKNDVGSIIIVNNKEIKGLFTEFDLVSEFFLNPNKLLNSQMKDLMTTPIICITGDIDLVNINRLMFEHHFRRLPVIDLNYNMVGIITQTDVTRSLYGFLTKIQDIKNEPGVKTPKMDFLVKRQGSIILYRKKN